jgi:hypothetical protein
MSSRTPDPFLTPDEASLITNAGFFEAKRQITQKVRGWLDELHRGLRHDLTERPLLLPPQFDLSRGQFVKGEHLEACPYQYLDFPKHYVGDEKFTFRTLFWWGHHVVCALIVEGGQVQQYKKNLVDRYHQLAGQDLDLSLAPTLWEWKRGEGYTLPITHDRKPQIAAVLSGRSWFKILRVLPLDAPELLQGRLSDWGRDTFRRLLPLISAT